jgi:hypothetical protein
MSIADKLVTIAENEQRVYEAGQNKGYEEGHSAGYNDGFTDGYRDGESDGFSDGYNIGKEEGIVEGKKAEYDAFWDVLQEDGKRTNYQGAFYGLGWTDANFKPKYDIRPTGDVGASSMFFMSRITNIAKALEDAGVVLDLSKATKFQSVFQACAYTVALPPIDMSSCDSCSNFVYGLTRLVSLELNNIQEYCTFSKAFNSCSSLENLIITGTIGQNFSVSGCNALTVPSLNNILACLKDYSTNQSGETYKLTLGATNLEKLTDAEKAIATQKGWTLA